MIMWNPETNETAVVREDGRGNGANKAETIGALIAEGYLLQVAVETTRYHRVTTERVVVPGGYSVAATPWSDNEVIEYIRERAYQICRDRCDALASEYSSVEGVRWSDDLAAIRAGDWSVFDMRAGRYMTGRQYAEDIVGPKLINGEATMFACIARRNDILYELAMADDPRTVDFNIGWPE